MTTRLDLIKECAIRIGDEVIASEDAPGADTYVKIFDDVRDDLLSKYPWKFATPTRRLVRLTATPDAHWKYFYQMPSEMIGAPRAVFDSADQREPFLNYEIMENRLATDAAAIWLKFTKRAEITIWPAYFLSIVKLAVRREAVFSIREDMGTYRTLGEELYGPPSMMGEGGRFGQAKSLDAQSGPSPIIAEGSNPLTDVRRG